jgi:cytochrome P450
MEMQLLLTGLLQRFDFTLAPNQNIEMEGLVTLRPRYGIKLQMS